jgi:cell division protein DivIC
MMLKIPSFIKNKYFIALLAVLTWLLFFDKNNFVQQWRMHRQLKELHQDKQYYLQEIDADSTSIRQLTDDPEAMERYARETYLMKKENEDIYIIKDPR